ncbi:MAG: hypothetical protein Q8R92_20940 [Deltaproteobacteria bacterium]|nr:hypothetical protein [Deltaproteobacteria bacterium]
MEEVHIEAHKPHRPTTCPLCGAPADYTSDRRVAFGCLAAAVLVEAPTEWTMVRLCARSVSGRRVAFVGRLADLRRLAPIEGPIMGVIETALLASGRTARPMEVGA